MLIFAQNSRSLARGCDGAPGDRNGARPVTSLIQFDGRPTTPSDQVLLPPVEPSLSVEFTIHMIFDADHEVQGIAATLRDVTERYRELRDLRRRAANA